MAHPRSGSHVVHHIRIGRRLATQAEGREATLAESNDGGAWLADRSRGGTAHVERLTREVTVRTFIGEPGSEISVRQGPEIVAIHDRTTSAVSVIDGSTAALVSTTSIPAGTIGDGPPRRLVPVRPCPASAVGANRPRVGVGEGPDEIPTLYAGTGDGRLVASLTGTVAVVEAGRIVFPSDDGELVIVDLPDEFESDHATFVGEQLVLVDGDRWITATDNGVTGRSLEHRGRRRIAAATESDMALRRSDQRLGLITDR